MNVSTAAAAATASSTDVSSTQSQSKTSNTAKTSEKSFDEEMKSVSTSEEAEKSTETSDDSKTSNNDNKVNSKDETHKNDENSKDKNDYNDLISSDSLSGGVNFTDYKYNNNTQSLLTQNIQSLLNTKDLMSTVNAATSFDYDVINMSDSDANFFANLVQNTDMSMKSISDSINQTLMNNNTQNVQKNVQVSSVLMEKLSESMKTNQPFRIDFDKDVSVIIKVNKDGSLAANFIPGDKAVEQYLRNNIASLRQRFDDQNLPYSELSYSNQNRQQQERRRNSNKENSNE